MVMDENGEHWYRTLVCFERVIKPAMYAIVHVNVYVDEPVVYDLDLIDNKKLLDTLLDADEDDFPIYTFATGNIEQYLSHLKLFAFEDPVTYDEAYFSD